MTSSRELAAGIFSRAGINFEIQNKPAKISTKICLFLIFHQVLRIITVSTQFFLFAFAYLYLPLTDFSILQIKKLLIIVDIQRRCCLIHSKSQSFSPFLSSQVKMRAEKSGEYDCESESIRPYSHQFLSRHQPQSINTEIFYFSPNYFPNSDKSGPPNNGDFFIILIQNKGYQSLYKLSSFGIDTSRVLFLIENPSSIFFYCCLNLLINNSGFA